MRHALSMLLVLMAHTTVAWAACVTIDTSTWTQAQKNQRQAVAYALAFSAGHDEVPTDEQGTLLSQSQSDTMCFSTFDPTGLITPTTMTSRWQADEVARQSSTQARLDEQSAALTEQQTNTVCQGNISDLDAKIDAITSAIVDLPTAKSALNLALKKIARCLRASAEIER